MEIQPTSVERVVNDVVSKIEQEKDQAVNTVVVAATEAKTAVVYDAKAALEKFQADNAEKIAQLQTQLNALLAAKAEAQPVEAIVTAAVVAPKAEVATDAQLQVKFGEGFGNFKFSKVGDEKVVFAQKGKTIAVKRFTADGSVVHSNDKLTTHASKPAKLLADNRIAYYCESSKKHKALRLDVATNKYVKEDLSEKEFKKA